jgi:phospholipid/cholesterol/gamma-HCH transport system substrate-binding protein
MPRSRLVAVGAFVIGGMLLFALGLFLIGNRRMLFTDYFFVYAEFANISGLQNGASVRVAGMGAGEVDRIEIPPGPGARFRVRMRIVETLRPLVRTDSVALIQTDGLVGNRLVQIGAGSEAAPPIQDEGLIRSREPFDFADLLESMSGTIALVNTTIDELTVQIRDALRSVSETANAAEALVDDVGAEVRAIAESGRRLTDDLTAVVAGVRRGEGTVGRLVTDDGLYESARRIAAEAEGAVGNLRRALS